MILVTGANGLLGSYLVRRLIDSGEKVRGLRRTNSNLALLGDYTHRMEWVEGDVTDIFSLDEAMKGVTKVYHCAAMISMQPGDANKMLAVNAGGTANVINAALDNNIEKLLYVSSVAAFGRPDQPGRMIDEALDVKDSKDNFPYFKSKLYAEREVWRGIAEGMNAVIINPSTILGGGFWSVPPNMIFAQIHQGMPFYADGINGFVDVRDVVEVAIALMNSEISAEKFIVSAENYSFGEVMRMAADKLQVRRPFIKVNRVIGALAWRSEKIKSIFSGVAPLATRDSIAVGTNDFRYSNDKILKALDYRFRPVEESVRDVANAYLQSVRDNSKYGLLV